MTVTPRQPGHRAAAGHLRGTTPAGLGAPLDRAAGTARAWRGAPPAQRAAALRLWTSDLGRGEAFAARLDAGHTAVNGMAACDPRLLFGGVKDSGYGRELSRHGLLEFVNIHAVVTSPPGGPHENRASVGE